MNPETIQSAIPGDAKTRAHEAWTRTRAAYQRCLELDWLIRDISAMPAPGPVRLRLHGFDTTYQEMHEALAALDALKHAGLRVFVEAKQDYDEAHLAIEQAQAKR